MHVITTVEILIEGMREYISISGEIWTSSVGIGNENA